jgi:hypothetical protein
VGRFGSDCVLLVRAGWVGIDPVSTRAIRSGSAEVLSNELHRLLVYGESAWVRPKRHRHLGRGDGRLPLREPTAVGETKHSRETACCMRNVHSAARRTSIHGDPRRKAPAQRLLGTAPTPPPPRRPPPSSTTRARRLLIVTASGRRHDHLRSQGGDDVAKIDDLDEVRDGVPIVTDACEAVAVSGADAGVSAEDALDSAPPVNESQWVLLVEHVGLRPQRRRARMRRGSGTQTLQATSAACR